MDEFKHPALSLRHEPASFLVCRNTETGKDVKLIAKRPCADFETMRVWVSRHFRRLELKECRPYDRVEDARRPLYPVPIQHVLFDPPRQVALPGPTRFSIHIRQPQRS